MVELSRENQPQGGVPTVSLADLTQVPIESRTKRILEHGQPEISTAIQNLRSIGAPLPRSLDAERLAWTIAFNVEGDSPDGASGKAVRGLRGYGTRWPLEKSWIAIWTELTSPLSNSSHSQNTLLTELALSVACEHRDEWQNPRARPIDHDAANRAFEFVYAANKAKVQGAIGGCFGDRAGNAEWVADEAWARVFCDYWSPDSRRRFLGLCRISTLVCQVARNIAIDALRRQEKLVSSETDLESSAQRDPILLAGFASGGDPSAGVERDQLKAHLKDCITRLPAKQRIVAEMVWFRQLQAKRVAEILRISEPAVSQHLKKARENLRTCLKEHGSEVPE